MRHVVVASESNVGVYTSVSLPGLVEGKKATIESVVFITQRSFIAGAALGAALSYSFNLALANATLPAIDEKWTIATYVATPEVAIGVGPYDAYFPGQYKAEIGLLNVVDGPLIIYGIRSAAVGAGTESFLCVIEYTLSNATDLDRTLLAYGQL